MTKLTNRIDALAKLQTRLAVQQGLLLEKAANSNSPAAILKAQKVLEGIQNREPLDQRKSYVLDPLEFAGNFGYKNRNLTLSYDILDRMCNSGIIAGIHVTRLNQVASFAEAQSNKYATGFRIQKRNLMGRSDMKITKQDEAKIELLTEFVLNCGRGNVWDNDDFDTFCRKFMRDSLRLDQAVFDVIPDKKGMPFAFGALDAKTFRIAGTYVDEEYHGQPREKVRGYLPNYVQLKDGMVNAEFYPWELCFGVRNPTTSMYNVGYGVSEQELLTQQITSMLWAEEYNRKFFSHGSMPKGFIRVDSTIPPQKIAEFRQHWNAMASGLPGAHRTPILEAGKIDWVDLHKSNNDMEFSNWYEFLIKLSCAIYAIDPAEINFPLSGGAEQKAMFEGNNEARLKHSKDKGLYPLLKFLQSRINKYVIRQIDPDFEFVFIGMEGVSEAEELDSDIKKLNNFETLNEVRTRRGLDEVGPDGDNVMSSQWLQVKQMAAMMGGGGGEEEGAEGNQDPGAEQQEFDESETDPDTEQDPDQGQRTADNDEFAKAFNNYLKKLN